MAVMEREIEVNVPVSTAYNQWTQFEDFPKFMEGIEAVDQIDDTTIRWRASVAGRDKEWIARITEQIPDERIAWQSEAGANNAGIVTFRRLEDPASCQVALQMEYDPEDFVESAGDALGFVKRRIDADLERFKEFIENRGQETGAWRGTVGGPAQRR